MFRDTNMYEDVHDLDLSCSDYQNISSGSVSQPSSTAQSSLQHKYIISHPQQYTSYRSLESRVPEVN